MTTRLNPTQIHLLRMFSADNTEKGLQELKEVLFAAPQKVDTEW